MLDDALRTPRGMAAPTSAPLGAFDVVEAA